MKQKWNAKRIKSIRDKYRLTQTSLHKIVGTPRWQTISEWERGVYEPSRLYLKLLDAAEVALEKMFSEANNDIATFHKILAKHGIEQGVK